MAETYINVSIKLTKHGVSQVPELTSRRFGARNGPLSSVTSLLAKIGSGAYRGNVAVMVADDTGTDPTHTIQVTAYASTTGETVTIAIPGGTVTLTEGTDFDGDGAGSNNTAASNLSTALNANADVVKFYDVTVATDTVTFTPRFGQFDEPAAAVAITAGTGMTATNMATGAPTTTLYGTFDNID